MTTSTPTTASLHREMVEALENARDYPSGCDCMVYSETTAWERHDWDCVRYVAGVALDGWERRAPLRDQPEVMRLLGKYVRALHPEDRDATVAEAADALEALLFGERG